MIVSPIAHNLRSVDGINTCHSRMIENCIYINNMYGLPASFITNREFGRLSECSKRSILVAVPHERVVVTPISQRPAMCLLTQQGEKK